MGTLSCLQTLTGHDDRVWSLSFSPSGDALASCSGDKTVRIWSKAPNSDDVWKCSAVLEDTHTRTIRSCSWSPNGRYLATASFDRTVAIWQVQGGLWEQIAMLEGHENEVKGVAWNPNGNLIATCSRDKTVWVWESAPGNEYEVVDVKHGHSQDVKTVVWSPDGEVLVSASYDDTIKLWVDNDDEWICAQTLGTSNSGVDSLMNPSASSSVGHTSTVWDVAFEPKHGRRLASCSDDTTVKIWACLKEGGELCWKLLTTLTGYHERTIFSIDWSVDGYIATGSADNCIRVFGEGDGEAMRLLCRHEEAHSLDVNCVRWHPVDGTLLASASDDCSIKIWRFKPDPL